MPTLPELLRSECGLGGKQPAWVERHFAAAVDLLNLHDFLLYQSLAATALCSIITRSRHRTRGSILVFESLVGELQNLAKLIIRHKHPDSPDFVWTIQADRAVRRAVYEGWIAVDRPMMAMRATPAGINAAVNDLHRLSDIEAELFEKIETTDPLKTDIASAPVAPKRRGRPTKEESTAIRETVRATLNEFPDLRFDPKGLATAAGVSVRTAERILNRKKNRAMD